MSPVLFDSAGTPSWSYLESSPPFKIHGILFFTSSRTGRNNCQASRPTGGSVEVRSGNCRRGSASGPQKRREYRLSDVTHVPHTGRFRTRPQTAPRFPFLFYIPWPECQRVGGRQTRAPSSPMEGETGKQNWEPSQYLHGATLIFRHYANHAHVAWR